MDEALTLACQQQPRRVPRATYRLQFNRDFTFKQANAIVNYLSELGISDVYASPLLQAAPDSTHGYDICSFGTLNPNLGSTEDFEQLATALRTRAMGLLLDMVPNHMGAALSNGWWRDVLEKGRSSPYATWFDIDWDPPQSELKGKVLLPVLEDHYAKVLEAGKLKLVFKDGQFGVAYYDRRFPLAPSSYCAVLNLMLEHGAPVSIKDSLLKADFPTLKEQLKSWHQNSDAFRQSLETVLQGINGNPADPASFEQLDQILRQQHYRLAFWHAGADEINYRRFFDVTELVSVRMELPEVFQKAHELVFRFIREGKINGLRIDHPDGLWDPKQYCERLQEACGAPFYVVVEKILTGEENLPENWAVAGTTGYDFLTRLNAIFVRQQNEAAFDRIYHDFCAVAPVAPQATLASPASLPFDSLVTAGKELVLQRSLISELHSLTYRLKKIAVQTRLGRDLTFAQLHSALRSVIVAFPVYRTYSTEESRALSAPERTHVLQAIQQARTANPTVDPIALEFIQKLLLLEPVVSSPESIQSACLHWVMKFQQLTSPVMAKGLEDTAFYNYNRLISLNEVGGEPGKFGASLESFHAYNRMKAAQWPHALLATATHDTKRGEDLRARLNVLSEMPDQWRDAVSRWARLNAVHKTAVAGHAAPSANDEYLFYQTALGAWIPEADTRAGLESFRLRVSAYMLKAIREAKALTSWTSPNEPYEKATERFIQRTLSVESGTEFLNDLKQFHRTIDFFGALNSLSQLVLKLTSPGVPDIYQGTELWDFNLVDPDNRRPVDYEKRTRVLLEIKAAAGSSKEVLPKLLQELLQQWPNGDVKLFILWRVLQLRHAHADLFQQGRYVPLEVTGQKRDHVCAFARQLNGNSLLVIASRFLFSLLSGATDFRGAAEAWGHTSIVMPSGSENSRWSDILSGASIEAPGSRILLRAVLGSFPVAILTTQVQGAPS